MADAHPTAQILGTDLSPTWHDDDIIRPNLSLEVDDCCSHWTYLDEGRNLFDLIHIRCLYGSIKDWKRLYQQAFDHLKPGKGYIEQAELSLVPHFNYTAGKPTTGITTGIDYLERQDGGLPDPDSVFLAWYKFWKECSEKTGKTWLVADNMAGWIYEIGFENVREVRYMLPLFGFSASSPSSSSAATSEYAENLNPVVGGGYPDYSVSQLGDIKKWFQQFWETGMEGWVLAISTRYMGWTVDEAKEFVAQTKKVLAEQSSRVYYELVIVYGRRPLTEGEKWVNHEMQTNHPELTGGIIATSSPSPITLSTYPSGHALVPGANEGKSTYSSPTLTLQLAKTFTQMPGYRPSIRGNNCDSGRGAGKDSLGFPVYADADAK
ncbi:hypothetical protein UA08_06175 [Talaromyces atroroseus]|uniref:S-adenosyl-L-methionine-dependent methyltransferase n=1 Tax=Talaromyces atroroseus TaxID=1441469 RepID=A0A225ABY3_TALAT|nr:hypothetical protein UA08_06175 [Talaromyces atroroseus]OKL58611.1 hypothetical protein UA08_06175 [Talaromyces atroroseus]